ncbi:Sterol 3-beta-glucosyltransferase UGT80A2 [Vitis vinifera]|uniref:Sterol 3-beta-glucosyltransferase UGT80A2 n=1 Tax=Vitis vinifera TaxID=29760 RepID=A0A438D4D1_VITVI|nr:Sterol 3-beta-glucosyltransferase UGT80A2 [Vitis vinifera]
MKVSGFAPETLHLGMERNGNCSNFNSIFRLQMGRVGSILVNWIRRSLRWIEFEGIPPSVCHSLSFPHSSIEAKSVILDWGPKVDVVGFCFLDLASNYEPPQELVKWLEAGQKPIYIGFGSLPVQEPEKMTQIIVDALEKTGQRGIINKGWGGLGNLAQPKESIYLLDNCPHDWLFLQCKAVVRLDYLVLLFTRVFTKSA